MDLNNIVLAYFTCLVNNCSNVDAKLNYREEGDKVNMESRFNQK